MNKHPVLLDEPSNDWPADDDRPRTRYIALDGWRWKVRSLNGKIIAESGEAYKQRRRCFEMANRLFIKRSAVVMGLSNNEFLLSL